MVIKESRGVWGHKLFRLVKLTYTNENSFSNPLTLIVKKMDSSHTEYYVKVPFITFL